MLTDRKGHTPAERIAAVRRYGGPITDQHRAAATHLLENLLTTAAGHGVTFADFDMVLDLPGGCLDVTRARSRKEP